MSNKLAIFMATHDKKCENIPKWCVPIQVGAEISCKSYEKILDNTGDNISDKNKVFCELTALYWMWKNTNYDYIGLGHYRRRFEIDDVKAMDILKKYDIILPKERKFKISLENQYLKEHKTNDWYIMIGLLKEMYPKYFQTSRKVFSGNSLYCYNMFISSRSIFDSYCKWLFPLLFEIEKKVEISDRSNYQKRYIGFLAERLLTLYVIHNNFIIFNDKVMLDYKKKEIGYFKNFINDILFKLG
ncbi:DUF4422 domain-containing protein [Clostridioides sp. ES-S-0123-01]|uniref:DUF4422 domain-containing protein n=1 Tax=Clostridioides sp. ES-S-0123-01 TaxID=2770783 RepID=UPI001D103F1D|nr:DUF4422 domain-containing protein [Clostridioides sp. ES-S-0123-01]